MKGHLYNLIASLKNGQIVKKGFILHEKKRICEDLLNILWDEGFILGYTLFSYKNKLKVYLKYRNGNPVIKTIQLVSKPSLRIYYSAKKVWKLKGFIILTTNQGLKTLNECKKLNIGGEPLVVIT